MGNSGKPMSRHEERQQALGFVYERMFRDDTVEDTFDDAFQARDAQVGKYVQTVVKGIEEHTDEIDKLIEENLKGWKKNRISKITLTILRIAVFEMLYLDNIPASVSINEAVELAKSYASETDAGYVNGVLGAVDRSLKKDGES